MIENKFHSQDVRFFIQTLSYFFVFGLLVLNLLFLFSDPFGNIFLLDDPYSLFFSLFFAWIVSLAVHFEKRKLPLYLLASMFLGLILFIVLSFLTDEGLGVFFGLLFGTGELLLLAIGGLILGFVVRPLYASRRTLFIAGTLVFSLLCVGHVFVRYSYTMTPLTENACERLFSQVGTAECFARLAVQSRDPSYCEKTYILGTMPTLNCFRDVLKLNGGDISKITSVAALQSLDQLKELNIQNGDKSK